jgi:hypothetical protein
MTAVMTMTEASFDTDLARSPVPVLIVIELHVRSGPLQDLRMTAITAFLPLTTAAVSVRVQQRGGLPEATPARA